MIALHQSLLSLTLCGVSRFVFSMFNTRRQQGDVLTIIELCVHMAVYFCTNLIKVSNIVFYCVIKLVLILLLSAVCFQSTSASI